MRATQIDYKTVNNEIKKVGKIFCHDNVLSQLTTVREVRLTSDQICVLWFGSEVSTISHSSHCLSSELGNALTETSDQQYKDAVHCSLFTMSDLQQGRRSNMHLLPSPQGLGNTHILHTKA